MLALVDTATGNLAPLEPRDQGRLSVYLCGPTVSGSPHVGHGRTNVVWDTLRRYLTWSGVQVRFVSNVTDIEDKIIARAAEEKSSTEEVAARYEALWWDTMGALNVQRPDGEPHATAYVQDMVRLVGDLVSSGHAYQGGDGVYFSTGSVPGTGSWPARTWPPCGPGRGSRLTARPLSVRRWTSRYGNWPGPASRRGRRPGDRAGPAGIPSAW